MRDGVPKDASEAVPFHVHVHSVAASDPVDDDRQVVLKNLGDADTLRIEHQPPEPITIDHEPIDDEDPAGVVVIRSQSLQQRSGLAQRPPKPAPMSERDRLVQRARGLGYEPLPPRAPRID